jgi:hypothetical protein
MNNALARQISLKVTRHLCGRTAGFTRRGSRWFVPDQHVAWTGDSAPGDADGVMHKVAGQEN